jgi:hypothetical protein
MSMNPAWSIQTYEAYQHSGHRSYGRATGVNASVFVVAGLTASGASQRGRKVQVTGSSSYAAADPQELEIEAAIDELRRMIRERLRDAVQGFRVERTGYEEGADAVEFVTLAAYVSGISREDRRAFRKELLEWIGSSDSAAVRERVLVSFR